MRNAPPSLSPSQPLSTSSLVRPSYLIYLRFTFAKDSFAAWIASIDGDVLNDDGGSADGMAKAACTDVNKRSPLKRRSSRQRQNAEKAVMSSAGSKEACSPKKRRSSRRQRDAREKKSKSATIKGEPRSDENKARGN